MSFHDVEITKSTAYKEVYISPNEKHRGFYRRYPINPDKLQPSNKLSNYYRLYRDFLELLNQHNIPEESKKTHDSWLKYKTKVIRSVILAKSRSNRALFTFSDYNERVLQNTRIVTRYFDEKVNGRHQNTTRRIMEYPDPDPKSETVAFVNRNLVSPLKALSGKVADCRGRKLSITGCNKKHLYQRVESRFAQYIEQYITERHYHNLRMALGYDVRDSSTPESIKLEFQKFRDVFEQHIRDDIVSNSDAMAKGICKKLIETVKNPLFVKEGNNGMTFQNSSQEGTTEFHSKEFTVVIAHSGSIMTFWPNSAGERFAIEHGWKGVKQSGKTWQHFVRNFDRRQFTSKYYSERAKHQFFNSLQESHKYIYHNDNYFIKYSQYNRFSSQQLLTIAKQHDIEVSSKSEKSTIIDALITSSADDVCWDIKGEYHISPMKHYDSRLFTNYDFFTCS